MLSVAVGRMGTLFVSVDRPAPGLVEQLQKNMYIFIIESQMVLKIVYHYLHIQATYIHFYGNIY